MKNRQNIPCAVKNETCITKWANHVTSREKPAVLQDASEKGRFKKMPLGVLL
jgi:hypothetical protein